MNEVYGLLLGTSRQIGGIILKGGRQFFRNKRGHGSRTSVMFTQKRGD